MADVKTDQEPSIEEILESIRQIISEDGEAETPAAASNLDLSAKEAPPAAPSDLSLTPVAEKPAGETTALPPLDLTDKVEPVLELKSAEEPPAPAPAPVPPPSPAALNKVDKIMTEENKEAALISPETATSVTDQLAKLLAGNVAVETEKTSPTGKVTLEDMVKEIMKPLVKTWLDQNLPSLIEKVVQKEVEKLSRRAADRD